MPSAPDPAAAIQRHLALIAKYKLPSMNGKSFLHLGCGEGTLCAYAHFEGAARAQGMDTRPDQIALARQSFPQCSFSVVEDLVPPTEQFDYLVYAPVVRAPEALAALLQRFMPRLNNGGILLLEVELCPQGITPPPDCSSLFTSIADIQTAAGSYACRVSGKSVMDDGSGRERAFVHLEKLLPYAILALAAPGSGKSTFVRHALPALPILSEDAIIRQLVHGDDPADAELKALLAPEYHPQRQDVMMYNLFLTGKWRPFFQRIATLAKGNSFVFDGFVPTPFQDLLHTFFKESGYFPVLVDFGNQQGLVERTFHTHNEVRKFAQYLSALFE